ncbi:hypothetical protein R2B67_09300 [Streptomyces cyaneofuscatus]|uniref:hypothetical protein n=1 Tax=Streptomyces cyaneofuscatus TaxID=66883 RepID=UPI002953916B|nr:hypothetical protein [Streptomyces cyaneofuscatus]WOP08741.1 hypothetical protein R2B67_09300 [Streptomyces cyaneofuscatus]
MAGGLTWPVTLTGTTVDGNSPRPPGERQGIDVTNRYWCGECDFRTLWLEKAEGQRQLVGHYARKHPGTPLGGHVENRGAAFRTRMGCLFLAAAAAAVAVWRR